MSNTSEVRTKAWQTRREKYGPKGHRGSYQRPPTKCLRCQDRDYLIGLVVKLHRLEQLSEGQAAKMLGIDRVELRKLADELSAT